MRNDDQFCPGDSYHDVEDERAVMNASNTHRPDTPELAEKVRAYLKGVARSGDTITYQGLAQALELAPPQTIHRVTLALEHLMAEDAGAGRPFIASLVVSKQRRGRPAPGFFDCAAQHGRFDGDPRGEDADAFHEAEFAAAIDYWSR